MTLYLIHTSCLQGGYIQYPMCEAYIQKSFSLLLSVVDGCALNIIACKQRLNHVAEVENNQACGKILETRMLEGVLPQGKLVKDVRGFSAKGTGSPARPDLIFFT